MKSPAAALAISLSLIIGCAVELEIEASPDPVLDGQDVTVQIKATNVTQCPIDDFSVTVFLLLDPAGRAMLDAEIEETLPFGLDEICEAAANGQVPMIDPEDLPENPLPIGSATEGVAAPVTGATCMEGSQDGVGFLQCIVPGMAAGQMQTFSITRPATPVGTLFTLAMSLSRPNGVCIGGNDDGQSCRADQDCDSNDCGDGFCALGNNPGSGCDDDGDCDGGSCTICAGCTGNTGVCSGTGGGQACTVDDDCTNNGECVCGVPFACNEVTVIAGENGDDCSAGSDCQTGNCVDGVCCNEACDGGQEACNLQGLVGICSPISAAAPAASQRALLIALAALVGIGITGVARRRTNR